MNSVFKPKLYTLLRQGISRKQVMTDVMAGVVVGIVALPLAIAFAVASGVSPEKGLITAVVAGLIISALGGSRVQIGGPTGAFIVIVFGIIQSHGLNGLLISTIIAGIILVMFGIFRLGSLLKYIPDPLIIGFTTGIAVVIFTTQIKDALGLTIEKMPEQFIYKWIAVFQNISTVNSTAAGICIATILIIVYSKKLTSKIPGAFLAITFITALVWVFKLPVTTIESFFGDIPCSFSFSMPTLTISELPGYIAPALAIATLGAIESLLSAVVADGMIGGNHRSNTELIAQGAANIVVPFFGGIPATGAIARTATNVKNGGRTPISGIVHAVTLLLIMLFFGRLAKLIPMSCLAGILIVVAYNMSEWRLFRDALKSRGFDTIVLLTTFSLTVFVDLIAAIEVGIVLSSLLFMKRMSEFGHKIPQELDCDVIEKLDIPEQVVVYEISGPLFFASAKQYAQTMREIGEKKKVFIIRMRHVPFVDSTGIKNLRMCISDLHRSGVTVILSGVNLRVHGELEKSSILSLLGSSNVQKSFAESLELAKDILNDSSRST
jgi:sulfate permease, SulP family